MTQKPYHENELPMILSPRTPPDSPGENCRKGAGDFLAVLL